MNSTLQKDASFTEEERIVRRRASAKKYMSRHQTMCVTLNEENDRDIITWLEKQENRSDSIRKAIKTYIALQESVKEAMAKEVKAREEGR